MKEIIRRLTLPSPKFFVRLKYIGGVIAGAGALIIGLAAKVPDSSVIQFLQPIAQELTGIGLAIVGMAQLTVKPDVPNSQL